MVILISGMGSISKLSSPLSIMTKNKDVVTRKAIRDDMSFIKESLVDSWREHAANAPELLSKEILERFESEKFYLDMINNDNGHILIAEVDDKKAGLIVAYESKLSYFFVHKSAMYIDDVYIVNDFRRLGIARQLITEVEAIAKDKKIHRIDNRVYTYNLPMQKLLASMGYASPFATWIKVLP